MRKRLSPFYRAYVSGPRWAARKQRYYTKHPRQCRACGATRNVQLHHTRYIHLGNEPDRDLMPVCKRHHDRITLLTQLGFNRVFATWLVVLTARSDRGVGKRRRRMTKIHTCS